MRTNKHWPVQSTVILLLGTYGECSLQLVWTDREWPVLSIVILLVRTYDEWPVLISVILLYILYPISIIANNKMSWVISVCWFSNSDHAGDTVMDDIGRTRGADCGSFNDHPTQCSAVWRGLIIRPIICCVGTDMGVFHWALYRGPNIWGWWRFKKYIFLLNH